MDSYKIVMPKLGESIQEAMITRWFVAVGDHVDEDTPLLEVATDKVDSEIPSPVAGVVQEIKYEVDALVPVGELVAVIGLTGHLSDGEDGPEEELLMELNTSQEVETELISCSNESGRFYSPLVRKMAKEHALGPEELASIVGSGLNKRVTKEDVLNYIVSQSSKLSVSPEQREHVDTSVNEHTDSPQQQVSVHKEQSTYAGQGDTIIALDRMRRLIADHMVHSKHTAAHVTSVIEIDVSTLVAWRNQVKDAFQDKYGEKLTFMPLFLEATAKALRDYPQMNASVDGDNLIVKKDVHIGVAVALPTGNLIVPVIHHADRQNLAGLSGALNGLAAKARENKLRPDDIQGGTFTITNFGSFKNIIGTPIINQPQLAILATGAIEKKVSVIESAHGDTIGIRHKMYLSMSYDHRVVDGMLGGMFLRCVGDYLEQFEPYSI